MKGSLWSKITLLAKLKMAAFKCVVGLNSITGALVFTYLNCDLRACDVSGVFLSAASPGFQHRHHCEPWRHRVTSSTGRCSRHVLGGHTGGFSWRHHCEPWRYRVTSSTGRCSRHVLGSRQGVSHDVITLSRDVIGWRHRLDGVLATSSGHDRGFPMTSSLWAVTCTVSTRCTRVTWAACSLKVDTCVRQSVQKDNGYLPLYLAAMVTASFIVSRGYMWNKIILK